MSTHGSTPSSPRRAADPGRRAFAAVLLLVLGLGLWGLYAVSEGRELHGYVEGATAPTLVTLDSGRTYGLSVPGGVAELARRGLALDALSCTLQAVGGQSEPLTIFPAAADTRAINEFATFASPESGRVHIECAGLGTVFVDDSEDAGFDLAGLWLLLASGCLLVGVPLLFSVLRARRATAGESSRAQAPAPASRAEDGRY